MTAHYDYIEVRKRIQAGEMLTVHPRHDIGYTLAWESADRRTRVGVYGECDKLSHFKRRREAINHAIKVFCWRPSCRNF